MSDGISATSSINQADYLKLFMQELTYQDPLKPLDNREFMTQMAQFSALQAAQTTNEELNSLIALTNHNQSLSLLNKNVKVKGIEDSGKVYHVKFQPDAQPLLMIEIKGQLIEKALTDITEVWS